MRNEIKFIFLFLIFCQTSFGQKTKINGISQKVMRKLKIEAQSLNLIYFLEPSCPICQKYETIINSIQNEYLSQKIRTTFIFPNKFSSKKEIVKFVNEIDKKANIILDNKKYFTSQLGATITPEVLLLNNKGEIIYQGAIDDWYFALGKNRKTANEFYLKNAINNYLTNKIISPQKTLAIGCDIEI
jgi:thioredoxin-related protein